MLTTCSWSSAHLVGLSDALDHLVGRHFLNLRSVRSSLPFFHHILDSGSPLLISGLSSNFSFMEKLPQCGVMPSDFSFLQIDRKNCPSVMVRLMDKSKVFHTSSPIQVSFLSPRPFSYCYLEFLIPGLWYCHRFGRFCKRCPFAWMMYIFNGLGICLSIKLHVC